MEDDASYAGAHLQAPEPNPALESLALTVVAWDLKGRESGPDGEVSGRVAFEWAGGEYEAIMTRVEAGGGWTGEEAVS